MQFAIAELRKPLSPEPLPEIAAPAEISPESRELPPIPEESPN
jgi:hypothetical protein